MKLLLKLFIIPLLLIAFLGIANTQAHAATKLGGMNLNGWCAREGEGTAALNSSNQWVCTGNNQVIDFSANPTPNCVWQYNVADAFAVNGLATTDPNYKYAWQCDTNSGTAPTPTPNPVTPTPTPPTTTTKLGGMNLNGWCAHNNEGTAALNASNQWTCSGNGQVINFSANPTPNCVWQYNISTAFAQNGLKTTDPNYKYAWACYAPGTIAPTGTPTPTPVATDDWTMQKFDMSRSSYNPNETNLNAANAGQVKTDLDLPCTASQGCAPNIAGANGAISDAPAVVNKVMYYGDWTGNFYAKNVKDGSTIWTRNIGVDTPPASQHCGPPSVGVVSSASVQNGVVYVAGADGNMYALNATNGNIIWKTQMTTPPNELLWDSPVLYNGSIYEGVASFGDCPLIQGRMVRLNASNGAVQATTDLAPNGCIGAGEWGSPTIDSQNNTLYMSTATNDDQCGSQSPEKYALAVVEMDATSLNILGAWRIPAAEATQDSDFGVSPTLGTATINGVSTQIVEAGNKNGHVYFFKRGQISAGPYLDLNLGKNGGGNCPDCSDGTISSAATDGVTFYQGMGMCSSGTGGPTSNCAGGGNDSIVYALNPATGAIIWQTAVPNQIVSTPILLKDELVVFQGNSMDILARSNGAILKVITPAGGGSAFDGTGAVAEGLIFAGNLDGQFFEFGL